MKPNRLLVLLLTLVLLLAFVPTTALAANDDGKIEINVDGNTTILSSATNSTKYVVTDTNGYRLTPSDSATSNYLSYDHANSTLTLNSFVFDVENTLFTISVSNIPNLTVKFVGGNSKISSYRMSDEVFKSDNTLTFVGDTDCSLSLILYGNLNSSALSAKNVVLKSGNLKVDNNVLDSYGIFATNDIIVEGGVLSCLSSSGIGALAKNSITVKTGAQLIGTCSRPNDGMGILLETTPTNNINAKIVSPSNGSFGYFQIFASPNPSDPPARNTVHSGYTVFAPGSSASSPSDNVILTAMPTSTQHVGSPIYYWSNVDPQPTNTPTLPDVETLVTPAPLPTPMPTPVVADAPVPQTDDAQAPILLILVLAAVAVVVIALKRKKA